MMKHADLHFLIGIILSPAIVATYPVSNHGVHYAKLGNKVDQYFMFPFSSAFPQVMLPQQLCSEARLPFADRSDSSGGLGYRASRCTFPRLPSQRLHTMAKIPRRQTDMLAMKAPSVPASSTIKPGVRVDLLGATSPFTFLKIHSPSYLPRPSSIPAAFPHAKPLGPDSETRGRDYPAITTSESPLDSLATTPPTSHTTKEPRGDA
ncbi:uncharacterized protein LOC114581533 [Podarcis muralis]